jgi:GMP synthase (glutamine-hydrolysing)
VQGAIVAVEDPQRRFFGLQYHPEVHHTKRGRDMLRHFLFDIAEVPADWKMESVLEEEMAKIADLVGILQHLSVT